MPQQTKRSVTIALASLLAMGFLVSSIEAQTFVLAESCGACHGTDGISKGTIPAIRGMKEAELKTALTQFKSGEKSSTVMGRLAKALTDDEIGKLAKHFSQKVTK